MGVGHCFGFGTLQGGREAGLAARIEARRAPCGSCGFVGWQAREGVAVRVRGLLGRQTLLAGFRRTVGDRKVGVDSSVVSVNRFVKRLGRPFSARADDPTVMKLSTIRVLLGCLDLPGCCAHGLHERDSAIFMGLRWPQAQGRQISRTVGRQ